MPEPDIINAPLPLYPAFTFSSSPTWFNWVKLTCYTIHNDLRARADYAPNLIDAPLIGGSAKPLLLFYLNYPIQYVQVVGTVVAIEDLNINFFLVTVDDSTGTTLDVIFWKPKPGAGDDDARDGPGHIGLGAQAPKENVVDEANILALLSTLQIGDCIQAKGTITAFRGTRQLSLLRLSRVRSTAAELKLIDARTSFYQNVLSRPWSLSSSKLKRLRLKSEAEEVKDNERARRSRRRAQAQIAREARHEKEIANQWEAEEKDRQAQAEVAKRAGEDLEKARASKKGRHSAATPA
jgi:hypothetical protein